ncbi:D-alanyl-D-alanine carboxypeptidase, partial [termite gut metagenome]
GIDGTLKDRMKVGKAYKNVTAKTGTITGISCLAGYVQTSDNHILAFAIMNQNTLSASKARKLQDMICEELAK